LEADFVDKFDRPETQISGSLGFFSVVFNEPRRREEREEGRGGRRLKGENDALLQSLYRLTVLLVRPSVSFFFLRVLRVFAVELFFPVLALFFKFFLMNREDAKSAKKEEEEGLRCENYAFDAFFEDGNVEVDQKA